MATMKQVGLLAAGCQPWNHEVCAANGDRFAYCATLAIYIYQLDRKYNEFCLHSIMSEHKKTITAISWNPRNPDLFASSSADNHIIVWNVAEQQVVAKLSSIKNTPVSIDWCPHEKDCLAFVYGRGPLFFWYYNSGTQLNTHKDAHNFMYDVCQFRWHPKKSGKMAFGHTDGSLSLFTPGLKAQKHTLRPETMEGTDEEDPISDLQWDPLSVEYLLVANIHHGVRLVDSEAFTVIMTFQLPSVAAQVHTIAWVNTAPGIFLTGDAHVGVMRIWNVSKSSPLESIRLKQTGFHALHVFSTAPGQTNSNNNVSTESHTSSTSLARAPSITSAAHYALPPAHAVCAFLDGGIGLYDLGRRKWNFLRDQGHIETIFDCKFKPEKADLLATASFDGTIKVWDINTMTCTDSSPGNEGVIYSLSWAPADLNCIAASTSRQGVFIWDLTKGKVIKRFNEHGKSSVYSVAWNQKDSRRLASCGADGYCVIRQVDGQLIIKYKHPGSVFGCDWSPNNKDMIATGCEDKKVRVFYLATTSEQPLKVFSGHTAKVFHVRWSPLREGILCSGSDDTTIRVWDYTHDTCMSTLSGHGAPVRGLLWSTEMPYLLVSGSWDYSIRIWDTRDGACLDTVLDHGADVYGLTSHPQRPFIVASCSRDSTVRVWSLTPLIQPLEINIIAGRAWNDIISTTENGMSQGTPPLLTGRASRDLKHFIDTSSGNTQHMILEWFSKFFMHPGGSSNLWELVSVVNGKDDAMLSADYGKNIMHLKHITRYNGASAQELEMIKMSKFGAGIGAPSKEDRIRKAAIIHIRLGNLQRYCELMVELGEWEKALSVAPGVSMKYWQSLAERRADYLMSADDDDSIAMCVATGQATKLVNFFTAGGRLKDAIITAAAAYEGAIAPPHPAASSRSSGVNGYSDEPTPEAVSLVERTSCELADWYLRNGMPVLAACCHLAVSDVQKAMAKLIRGNELELAVSVGKCCQGVEELTCLAAEHLARRCERLGHWSLAVDLLKGSHSPDIALAKVCGRCAASVDEINHLHTQAGYLSMDECTAKAETLRSSDVMEAIKYYIISSAPEVGLELGLKVVKERIRQQQWKADDVFGLLQLLGAIRTEKLQQNKCSGLRAELLILSAYIGTLVAIRRRYDSIVYPMFQHTKFLMKRESIEVSLSESLVISEMEAWNAHQTIYTSTSSSSPKREKPQATMEQRTIYEDLLRKAGAERSAVGVGSVCVSGSNLPCHSDVHNSCLNGQRIQGPAFFLEDGRSCLAISDAVMWASVNPFSPLGSGVRINPF